jgi:hypothetical protein
MRSKLSIFRNIVLPVMILLPLIGIMVGCIVIPTWDHAVLRGTERDFRGWAASHEHSPPWDLDTVSRPDVEALFGKPPFASRDGRTVAYVMGTENGIIIWPLCFGVGFAHGKAHVLKLVYNDSNHLKRIQWLETERDPAQYWFFQMANSHGSKRNLFGPGDPDPMAAAAILLNHLNDYCPPEEQIDIKLEPYTGRPILPATLPSP